jgi:hypothetical protein
MNNARSGKLTNCDAMHSLPVESVAFATSPKRTIPTFRYRLPERRKRIDVSRHSIVRVVYANHGA